MQISYEFFLTFEYLVIFVEPPIIIVGISFIPF